MYELGEVVENIVRNHNHIEKHRRKYNPDVINRDRYTGRTIIESGVKSFITQQKSTKLSTVITGGVQNYAYWHGCMQDTYATWIGEHFQRYLAFRGS